MNKEKREFYDKLKIFIKEENNQLIKKNITGTIITPDSKNCKRTLEEVIYLMCLNRLENK